MATTERRSVHRELAWDPAVTSKFRSLDPNAETILEVSFPKGLQVVACCGASHGWLIVANELSDLVLYNPFTSVLIPLPPINGFAACVKGVYGDEGNIMGYRYGSSFVAAGGGEKVHSLMSLGAFFYDKVVLSGSPSRGGGGAIVAMAAIHMDGKRLSFARVGESCWQDAQVIRRTRDSYADCVSLHGDHGRGGQVMDLGREPDHKPRTKVIVSEEMEDNYFVDVVTRYLVLTPWGRLLQVRVVLDMERANRVSIEIYKLDLKRHRMVKLRSAAALRGHAAFVGQNSSGCLLPADQRLSPELKPDSIYFTTPRLRDDNVFDLRCNEWKGVKIYDLKKRKLETAFLSGGGKYGTKYPSEVWFMPNL